MSLFNITHNPKPGVCKRRRCSRPAVEQGLCAKDLAEWRAAGSPPWAATGSPITGTSLVLAGEEHKLAAERISAQQSLDLLESLEITDQRSMDIAGSALEGVREARRSLAARQDEALAPIKQSLEDTKAFYAPIDTLYKQAEAIVRDKINEYLRMQQAAQDAARAKVAEAGGSVDGDTLVLAHGIENVALPVGMGVREPWGYTVSDEAALRRAVALGELVQAVGLVRSNHVGVDFNALLADAMALLGVDAAAPREFLCLDHKALAKFARSDRGETQVPGVAVTQTMSATAPRRSGTR